MSAGEVVVVVRCWIYNYIRCNAMPWVHHLLYQSIYKYIIKVCTLKNCWWGGIVESGFWGSIYKKCILSHPLKITSTIPGIPCYMYRQGQNFTPLNFETDPISILEWQVYVYTSKCMIPNSVLWLVCHLLHFDQALALQLWISTL